MGRKKKTIAKEILENEYWEMGFTIRQIANNHSMAKDTINKLLANYDISVRSPALGPVKSLRKTTSK
jgi:plasmid maintenance system antidote protein VapI